MNSERRKVVTKTLCLTTNIVTSQFITYIHFKEDYYV